MSQNINTVDISNDANLEDYVLVSVNGSLRRVKVANLKELVDSTEDVVVVDTELSTTSVNPVQNRVITTELNKKANSSDMSTYQTKRDNTLTTTSKEVVGAINENTASISQLSGEKANKSEVNELKEDTVNLKKEIDNLKLIVKKEGQITDMTWSRVQQIVANGSGSDAFEIGAQIIEKWTDTADSKEYDIPWQVNHFEDMTLEDGEVVHGMWLQSHYTFPFGIQFSHQRAFLACPDGLSAGTYNFDFAKAWGKNVQPGINYQFTLTNPVERGGRLAGCYGAPDQAPSSWKVYSYGKDGITLNETVNVTVGSGGTNLGTIQHNSRSGNLNSVQEMAYGWNRWKTSALRQWLNSNKPKNQWWKVQDQWDICPDQLASKDGFLCGMPEQMLNSLKKVKVSTFANTVNDEGVEDITYDYVTLPSLGQIYAQTQIAGEGNPHTYWKRRSGKSAPHAWYQDDPNMITYSVDNKTSAKSVRLRSASRDNAYFTWLVYSSGSIICYGNASSASACSPLVCIA